MRPILSTALALALCSTAFAEPPKAVIVGPTGGKPGDILVLDATESTGDYFAWKVTPELDGRPTILPIGARRERCIVVSLPGTWHVFLAVGNAEGVDLVRWTVQVGDDPPGPEPGPRPPEPNPVPPGPGPQPPAPEPLPDGEFGVSREVYDAAKKVGRPAEAHALAGAFEGVAAAIAAGTLRLQPLTGLPTPILAAIREANNDALPADVRHHWQAFAELGQQRIETLYRAGRLNTAEKWAVLCREVAIGLRAVT